MSSGAQHVNNQQPSSTWTEPPWSGWIETTGDALLILEAARRGLIPRVTRRLVDAERKMITSGSVFVFDEDESGIKRWTDGFFWSPSRILGNFLLYRETEKRGAGHPRPRDASSDVNEQSQYNVDGAKLEGHAPISRSKSDASHLGVNKNQRILLGSHTNSYKFKQGGLMKKTFSLTIDGVSQHLISYYNVEDVENGRLRSPSSLPELASLDINPGYLDKTHFRNPPKVEMGPDGILRYRGEADDLDTSPSLLTGPLSSEPPLLSPSVHVRNKGGPKRFLPYPPSKPRKNVPKSPTGDPPSSPEQGNVGSTEHSTSPTTQQPPPVNYPDPNAPPNPHYPPFSVPPGYYQYPGYHPPPHVYPPGAYPSVGGPVIQPPNAGPPQPAHYPYSSYPGAQINELSQPPNPGQQPYIAYYPPPPHGSYPPYPGVPWPSYSGYSAPHQPSMAVPADGNDKSGNLRTSQQQE